MAAKVDKGNLSHVTHDPAWGAEPLPPIPDGSFYDLIKQTVWRYPSKTALISLGKHLSYAEMDDLSGRFANALIEAGVKKGDRVGVLLPTCAQHVAAFHGIIRAGAISVPCNVMLKQDELEYIYNDAGVEVVVAIDLLCPVVEAIKPRTKIKKIISVHVKDISAEGGWIPPILSGPKSEVPGALDFEALVRKYPPDPPKIPINQKEDPALIIYTAGTTGFPKGVIETHYNMIYSCLIHAHLFDMSYNDVNLQILPMFHIGGYFLCLHALLYRAGTVVLVPSFDAGEFLKMGAQYAANTIVAPPTLYVGLLNHPDIKKYDFTTFKFTISAGAPVPIPLQKRWQETTGVELNKGWGMTETNAGAIVNLPNKRNLDSIGVPLSGEVKIVDEQGDTTPRGVTGEIWMRSPQVAKGYWNKPEETAKTFTDGWLHTGDAGYMDEEGFIFFVDRIKDLIIASGYNIAPTEVEAIMMKHEAVSEAGVVGVPDEYRGETVKAFIVLKDAYKDKISAAELETFCRENMAAYKIPRIIEFIDVLPKNQVGKVLRYKLKEM
jgi:long-chain acyl-CoA synthetase